MAKLSWADKQQRRWQRLRHIWGDYCILCNKKLDFNIKNVNENSYAPTIEHLIPVSKGGTWTDNNLAIAHSRCNNKRGNDSFVKAAIKMSGYDISKPKQKKRKPLTIKDMWPPARKR